MADFLLELFSEEIPARMQPAAAKQLAERFAALLAEAGLSAATLETHATPRRLALLATGLPKSSAATAEERRGPRADAPAQAIEGFLKSTGLTRDQLEERDTGKGVFLFATLKSEGRPTADILAEKLPALIAGFQWPKSQRWGPASDSTASPRWVRPLRGIVALLDTEVVPFEAMGLTSGRETFGHRFMGPKAPISIHSPGAYAGQLLAANVVLSAEERRAIIREGAEKAAAAAGLKLRPDEGLEAENAGLTEWPVPLLGRFDPAYLDVPPEVIQLTMRTNQKYFAVEDAQGQLAPAFVCVANLVAADGGATIIGGNQRVLSARLSDARFFWEMDKQVPLETRAEALKGVVFHEKLGTMAEKVDRVAKLARWLVETHPDQFPGADADTVERAARLAKADLTAGTVGEFPELQGIIGGYLAEVQGEKPGIVSALKQHYAPVPEGCVPVAVALADRLDTVLSMFAIVGPPTGSKDPFAQRRYTLGAIAMIEQAPLRASLLKVFDQAFQNGISVQLQKAARIDADSRSDGKKGFSEYYSERLLRGLSPLEILGDFFAPEDGADKNSERLVSRLRLPREAGEALQIAFNYGVNSDKGPELLSFFADRLKVQQREAGVRHDLIDAVFALGGEDDFVRLLARVKALQAFVETDEGKNLLAGYKRAANILKAEEKKDEKVYTLDLSIPLSKYIGETEKNLARLFVPADRLDAALLFDEADALLAREDFEGAMKLLATLREPVDQFFEHTTVNDPDPATRERRLRLLAGIRDVMHRVADFSKIEG
jgi:glycyl-tRNA synthetase beta chain